MHVHEQDAKAVGLGMHTVVGALCLHGFLFSHRCARASWGIHTHTHTDRHTRVKEQGHKGLEQGTANGEQ